MWGKVMLWMVVVGFLQACPARGQAAKALDTADYRLWGTLRNGAISETGKWTAYSVSYESGADTLFLRRTGKEKAIAIPKGEGSLFIGDRYHACLADGAFELCDLESGRKWTEPNVARFVAAASGKRLVLLYGPGPKAKSLEIRTPGGATIKAVPNVRGFWPNDRRDRIAYGTAGPDGVHLYDLPLDGEGAEQVIASDTAGTYENVRWDREGSKLAFIHRRGNSGTVHFFDAASRMHRACPVDEADGKLDSRFAKDLMVFPDGKRVFYTLKKAETPVPAELPDIWNTADRQLRSNTDPDGSERRWVCWEPDTGRRAIIGSDDLPGVAFTGVSRYILNFGSAAYMPTTKHYADRDGYVLDLATGVSALLEKQLSGATQHLRIAPVGTYVAYFARERWFAYDMEKGTRTDLSAAVGRTGKVAAQEVQFAAWVQDGRSCLFHDEFDIWEMALGGAPPKRLTVGRENGTVYRLYGEPSTVGASGFTVKFRSTDFASSGLAKYENGKMTVLAAGNAKFSGLLPAAKGGVFSYLSERFDKPPALWRGKAGRAGLLYESNAHAKRFEWGKPVRVGYTVGGKALKGILYRPPGYTAGKQYPMVVLVYERQGHLLYAYDNPSLHNNYGFNLPHLLSQGYTVLLPDIDSRMGEPGRSALECTVAAVQAALATGAVDRDRIGLMGHSFGGYETNYIITQTGLFRCAVSGDAVTDYVSLYLSEDKTFHHVSYWRFEADQRRMGVPFYEDRERYIANSPVQYADRIRTPLLQFTGARDTQVDPSQSFELHLALRRLGKENILLVYPGEGHILASKRNQADLTLKVCDWFAWHLKDGNRPSWAIPR